jgi:hypothetical protein
MGSPGSDRGQVGVGAGSDPGLIPGVPALLFLLAALFCVSGFEELLRLYVAGPDGPILTDDKPLVEYFLSLPRDRDVNLSGVRGDVTRYVVQP